MNIVEKLISTAMELVQIDFTENVNKSAKKYMERFKFIFDNEYNVVKAELNFIKYSLATWTIYLFVSMLGMDLFLNFFTLPNVKISLYVLFIVFIMLSICITIRLFKYFIGDIGEVKNIDYKMKEMFSKYKYIRNVICVFELLYISIMLYIFQSIMPIDNETFYIHIIGLTASLYIVLLLWGMNNRDEQVKKLETTLKKYYKNQFEVATIEKTYKLRPSTVTVQMLSNNDIVLIDNSRNIPIVIDSKNIKYIRIEDDAYYLSTVNGIEEYIFCENEFTMVENARNAVITRLINECSNNEVIPLE